MRILNFTSLLPRYENFPLVIPLNNYKPTPFALPKPLPTCFHKLISSRVLCVKIFCQLSWCVKCLQCQHIKLGWVSIFLRFLESWNPKTRGWQSWFLWRALRKNLCHFSLLPAAAAKSLQSCPTLWDLTDGSPPSETSAVLCVFCVVDASINHRIPLHLAFSRVSPLFFFQTEK